jgi:subtilisin family serine protease
MNTYLAPVLAAVLLFLSLPLAGQSFYWVGFTDKEGTPYRIEAPEEFLSERALLRRQKQGLAIDETDLPVSPQYVRQLRERGLQIWQRSRWLNGVVVVGTIEAMKAVEQLPFVREVEYTGPVQDVATTPASSQVESPVIAPPTLPLPPVSQASYGASYPNLQRMRGDTLHELGYRGEGVLVAVLDGGFPQVDQAGFLGSYAPDEVPVGYDFVEQDANVYDGGTHGSTVLSVMAARHPFFLVGVAPAAEYLLFKTENGQGEYRQEEYNWVMGIEKADSLGADIANSSLGYTTFDDERMDYTVDDLDGQQSPASRAASMAVQKGMIVCISAGNSGGDSWRYIGTPADAPGVIAVGALDRKNERAYFSSLGYEKNPLIKPDLMAPGTQIPGVSTTGRGFYSANGTSLASPLLAGLVACLWQAFPDRSNEEIMQALKRTADRGQNPDREYGYGIPNFAAAYRYLAQLAP